MYAHVLQDDEADLSFADFSSAGRLEAARIEDLDLKDSPNYVESMVRREGFEPPTLRFEERIAPPPQKQEVTRSTWQVAG